MVRAGRVLFDDEEVTSVIRDAKADETRVSFSDGSVRTFKKYGKPVWKYFKDDVEVTLTV